MRIVAFTLIIFFTHLVMAAPYVKGGAEYTMKPAQTLSFAKAHLHYWSYRNIISQELQKLGLNPIKFWQKYDQSFKESFFEHEERYQKALAGAKSTSDRNRILATKKEFELRKKKNFAGISHVIISDAIKSFGSKLGSPNIKTMKIEAKVNYKALRKLYSRFMIDTLVTKNFEEVVIKSKFDWGNVDFQKLGGMLKDQVELSVLQGWKDWFVQNTSLEKPILVYFEHEAPEQTEKSRASLFINFIAREGGGVTYPIHYQASLALKDAKTDNFVFLQDISNIKKFYKKDIEEGKRLANDVFSVPIPYFIAVRSMLEKSILTNHSQKVLVRNYKNIDDVLKIQDKLKTLGISLNLVPSLNHFESSNASLKVRHNGTNAQLKEVLTKVQNIFFPVELIMTDTQLDQSAQVL